MSKIFKAQLIMALFLVGACVTVNIYFPAAEVKKDAERVVKEAYGIDVQTQPGSDTGSELNLQELIGPTTAHAQDYVNLNNAATRGAESQVVANTQQLIPFYQAGNVGLDMNGFATMRDQAGLGMQQVGQVNQLISRDRQYKQALYQAKAEAAGTPGKAADVQAIYAGVWKQYAGAGWWVQSADGGWSQK